MPELPEVQTVVSALKDFIIGAQIDELRFYNTRLRQKVNESFVPKFIGLKIKNIFRRAKYIVIEVEDFSILVHLGMSGSVRIVTGQQPLRKHDHIEMILSKKKNKFSIRYHDPRRFGLFQLQQSAAQELLQTHPLLNHLGIEPLGDDLTMQFLFDKSRNKTISVKNFLLDAKMVCGIGNIYANEILFLAKIHPLRSARALTMSECKRLPGIIKKVLQQAIDSGGSTLRDFVNAEGNPGYFQLKLNVYGRDGQPCRRCKSKENKIEKIIIGQRSSFFCPRCQN